MHPEIRTVDRLPDPGQERQEEKADRGDAEEVLVARENADGEERDELAVSEAQRESPQINNPATIRSRTSAVRTRTTRRCEIAGAVASAPGGTSIASGVISSGSPTSGSLTAGMVTVS